MTSCRPGSVLAALEAELAALAADRIASPSASAPETTEALEDELDARIVHGAPFTVKKSTFQAHVCGGLTDASQVDAVMSALRRNGKVARATHNIMAYRVGPLPGTEDVWAQDHDEDGENAARKIRGRGGQWWPDAPVATSGPAVSVAAHPGGAHAACGTWNALLWMGPRRAA